MKRFAHTACLVALLVLTPVLASAHPGQDRGVHHFADGFAHPFTGLDHVLTMTAVGLWSIQLGRRARWWVPLGFPVLMISGAALAMSHVHLPYVESAILASALITGLLLAAALPVPPRAALALAGTFALFHGYAHTTEMPGGASPLAYITGFSLATATLLAAGSGLGVLLTATRPQLLRASGVAIALGALLLAFA
jgi:urease accessory protein